MAPCKEDMYLRLPGRYKLPNGNVLELRKYIYGLNNVSDYLSVGTNGGSYTTTVPIKMRYLSLSLSLAQAFRLVVGGILIRQRRLRCRHLGEKCCQEGRGSYQIATDGARGRRFGSMQ